MELKIGTCATCAYFHDGVTPTECRYNPPQMFPVMETAPMSGRSGRIVNKVESKWPAVDSDDWCSHYYNGRRGGVRKNYARLINEGEVERDDE